MKTIHRILLCILPLAALNFACAAGSSDILQRKRQSPDHIRIVSANVRVVNIKSDKASGDDWDKRKELARDVLLAQDADIICFQEFLKEHLDFLADCFPGYGVVGFIDTKETSRKPNTVFYSKKRFEKIADDGAFLSPTPEIYRSKFEESSRVRSCTRLHLKDRLTRRELIVWNTHFDHKNQIARDKQSVALMGIIKQTPSGIPQILTGDLNCAAATPAVRTIKESGFTDTHTTLHGPADPGFTYHRFLGPKYERPGMGKIDFIFSNSALRPVAAEIIRDGRNGRYPSDHYFVSSELEYAVAK